MKTKEAIIEKLQSMSDYDFYVLMAILLMIDFDIVRELIDEEKVNEVTEGALKKALEEENNEQ